LNNRKNKKAEHSRLIKRKLSHNQELFIFASHVVSNFLEIVGRNDGWTSKRPSLWKQKTYVLQEE